uniref:Uncharacterized protein n=1 Tax=Haptolina ericina TaxID=156174 RepID=A0A7S3AN39_9EUKA|mmetsp:Transcript_23440/g.53313  ORF Transcript_23440/g.53313 Transcript_23440/m.53313 type:complete len:250 (+) Transcript_23440:240-989(+)
MFPDKNDLPGNSDPNEKRVSMALATHALAFQITSLGRGGRRLQRVVGVHAVRDCTADLLNDLVWETIGHLVQPWRKLFFISDPAHALKKPANNWEKSTELGCRNLLLPDPIVRAILDQVHQPLAETRAQTRARTARRKQQGGEETNPIANAAARTEGEETFIYMMGRIYEHMTDHKPYMAKSAREIERDARVIELRFLLKIQLHFDLQLEIEGFLGLLHDQVERHGSVALLPRKLSQDTLESLFGCRRE